MHSKLAILQQQQNVLDYVYEHRWKQDEHKLILKQIILELQTSISIDIHHFIDDATITQCIAYIYSYQQQIRSINHSLQDVFNKSFSLRNAPQLVISALPSKSKQYQKLSQILNPFKQNLIEIQQCIDTLLSVSIEFQVELPPISKKINLPQIVDNFKFEIKCLRNELYQFKTALGNRYREVCYQIDNVEMDYQLMGILLFVDSYQNLKQCLKKQQQLIQYFEHVEINEITILASKEKKSEFHLSSQDTASTEHVQQLQVYDKENINLNNNEQACICTIF